jgi:uncharacterized membrane protein YdjX (TVP38/TMEM64 family)
MPATDPLSRRGSASWLKLGALVVLLAVAYVVARATGVTRYSDVHALADAAQRARGARGAVPIFLAAYVACAALGLPALPLTLAGGAIFGFPLGTLLNWTGAILGATGSFLLARALGHDAVVRLLGSRAASLDRLAGAHGFSGLLRLRLIPVVPFNVLNFGSGLAGVPLRPFLLATAIGIVPGTAVYTYFADSLLAGARTAERAAFIRVAVAGGLLVALSFVPSLIRRLMRRSTAT